MHRRTVAPQTVDLRQSRDSRKHPTPLPTDPGRPPCRLRRQQRTRPHKAHRSLKNVHALRQLIPAMTPQPRSKRKSRPALLHRQRPELQNPERLAPQPHPELSKKERAGTLDPLQNPHHRTQHRHQKNQDAKCASHIEGAFESGTQRADVLELHARHPAGPDRFGELG